MRHSRRPLTATVSVLLAAAFLAGCGWPRDPAGASARVEGKVLRVGASDNPPWVRVKDGRVGGVEARLVQEIARAAGARIAWVTGGESALLPALEAHRLDLVAGGITSDSPWAKKLGPTRPYATVGGEKHLLLAPPGENGWILRVDRVIYARRGEVAGWLAEAGVRP